MPGEFLLHATGMWPLKERPASRFEGEPIALIEIAASRLYDTVRPLQEERDGRPCHVLEWPGRGSLWIDADRGFTLMARDLRDKNSGDVMERIELGGHREVKGGIWLPTWIRNIQFDFRAKTAEGRQRRAIDGSLRLLAVQVNEDVPAELFHFAAPPGAVVGSAERPADPDKPRRGGSRGSLGGMVARVQSL